MIQQEYEPIGDDVEVTSGQFPGDHGAWTLFAYETRAGVCTAVETATGRGGGCGGPEGDHLFSMSSSDGSGDAGEPPWAAATVRPEVARLRWVLDDDETIERDPIDVGLEVNFAMAVLPPGTQVVRVEALDADGEVLESSLGLFFFADDLDG